MKTGQCPGGYGLPVTQLGGTNDMNVGAYAQQSQAARLPLLDSKLFKRLAKKGRVTAKMIACREIKSPNFKGLAMDFKNGHDKFSFLARFDRFDIPALIGQLKSEETDDWIGANVKFILRPSEKGGGFVNVEFTNRKKK